MAKPETARKAFQFGLTLGNEPSLLFLFAFPLALTRHTNLDSFSHYLFPLMNSHIDPSMNM